jgi:hypothetical protein
VVLTAKAQRRKERRSWMAQNHAPYPIL